MARTTGCNRSCLEAPSAIARSYGKFYRYRGTSAGYGREAGVGVGGVRPLCSRCRGGSEPERIASSKPSLGAAGPVVVLTGPRHAGSAMDGPTHERRCAPLFSDGGAPALVAD